MILIVLGRSMLLEYCTGSQIAIPQKICITYLNLLSAGKLSIHAYKTGYAHFEISQTLMKQTKFEQQPDKK